MAKKIIDEEPMLEENSDEILLEETSSEETLLEETSSEETLLEETGESEVLFEESSDEVLLEESADSETLLEEVDEKERKAKEEAIRKAREAEEERLRKEAEAKAKAEAERKKKLEDTKNKRVEECPNSTNSGTEKHYKYCPPKKSDLRKIIVERIRKEGNAVNLNDIDTSKITSMNGLFSGLKCAIEFNGDVSEWDVSKVRDMSYMFQGCVKFEGKGLEKWDVSKVEYMSDMFEGCINITFPQWYKVWAKEADARKKADIEKEEKRKEEAIQKIIDKLIANMVLVEGGTFIMGATPEQGTSVFTDEKPTHIVKLNPFMIGRYEVTLEEWEAIMNNRYDSLYALGKIADLPETSVSWNDCQTFIAKLNALTGQKFRLPTEAEWEFAARGGNKSKGFKYAGSNDLEEVAWTWKNSGEKPLDGEYDEETIKSNHCKIHEVGKKVPNELGLYDMCGNVWEWCSDWFGDYSSSDKNNPQGSSSGTKRVVRGGAYQSKDSVRVAYRHCCEPDKRWSNYGFRLVADPTSDDLAKLEAEEAKRRAAAIKTYNGHQCVDLGLPSGTLWATCNIGASKPEESGNYFSWGETTGYDEGKREFDDEHYKFITTEKNLLSFLVGSKWIYTKYCDNKEDGKVDNKSSLEKEDDAAHVQWGEGWRIPTKENFKELGNEKYTEWRSFTMNGIEGLLITSKVNGLSIFFPKGGKYIKTEKRWAAVDACYWSRTLGEANHLACSLQNTSSCLLEDKGREYGMQIRPVRSK